MASIILGAAASAITGSSAIMSGFGFLSNTARFGIRTAAGIAGRAIDRELGIGGERNVRGPQLSSLSVQSSAYGDMIPKLYGTVRVAGNIIWAQPIRETSVTTSTSIGGKGGGPALTRNETTFSYSATLAIAICEGEIDDVLRVWADALLINPSDYAGQYTLYKGDETQLPDAVIESFEGAGNVPAYRGLAYVVIEDFPLAEFGNRIPNFSFEVKKKALSSEIDDEPVENVINALVMIPGSGEFVYDTETQYKVTGEQVGAEFAAGDDKAAINQHNASNKANALLSLDQLQETLPNVEWVAVVVNWFGTSIDAGDCVILPGVEYQTGATTEPEVWTVGGFTRATARQITLVEGSPRYGGTPDDQSLLRYLDELNARGYSILFYPMPLMDVTDKPWRGRITGTASEVADFFTKTNGYNAFITHYANLVKTKVDAFIIGSELIGLTKVQDVDDSFPAVDELVALAATVKGIVGGGVKVSYAADWSEYHHTDGGWYNLDPLWASSNIDFVGIDAYFPLTNEPQSGITKEKIIDGWTSGEGYDFYYTDEARTTTAPLSAAYAWKNIAWWWSNTHTNPDASATAWVPESKPIWFTEYGFPSLDGCSNQPNVFYDPNSSESAFPRFSQGRVDFRAQRLAITATEEHWAGSSMIERMFLWTWDARPYPFWPDLISVWADGGQWKFGHWVQGKLGLSTLGAIVADLCAEAGMEPGSYDTSDLTDLVNGYTIPRQMTARAAIEQLRGAYFFDAVERDGVLTFVKRGGVSAATLQVSGMVRQSAGGEPLEIARRRELDLPAKVDVTYLSRTFNYQVGDQHARRMEGGSDELFTLNLPIVLSDQEAKTVADATLYTEWTARTGFRFTLPLAYGDLEPSDIITVQDGSTSHVMRVEEVRLKENALEYSGVAEDVSSYDFYSAPGEGDSQTEDILPVGETRADFLDTPPLPGDSVGDAFLRVSIRGEQAGWKGAVLYRSNDGGSSYNSVASVTEGAVAGVATTSLADGVCHVFDEVNSVTVLLERGELESMSELAVLNGANAAMLGDELIQFRNATLVSANKYTLSGLLRGRQGTEWATGTHAIGDRFALLDNRLTRLEGGRGLIGLNRKYKPVSVGKTLAVTEPVDYTYAGRAFKPFAPVHLSGARDGASNLTIAWVRRARLNHQWRDYVDIPLDEASERYEVEILDGGNVARTISGLSSPAASYTAAQQTADFGSPQASVDIRVYQLSEVIGRGYAGEGSV